MALAVSLKVLTLSSYLLKSLPKNVRVCIVEAAGAERDTARVVALTAARASIMVAARSSLHSKSVLG